MLAELTRLREGSVLIEGDDIAFKAPNQHSNSSLDFSFSFTHPRYPQRTDSTIAVREILRQGSARGKAWRGFRIPAALIDSAPPADKAEALQSAEKADPRVDLEWMRIRYERDLDLT